MEKNRIKPMQVGKGVRMSFSKQKEVLEKFDDCYSELTDINERQLFVYAFRLGMRIAIEVLCPDTD